VKFSPNGTMLVSGLMMGKVKLWNIEQERKNTFDIGSNVDSVAFSPDGKILAIALRTRDTNNGCRNW
jgi:WD40 repeat protein